METAPAKVARALGATAVHLSASELAAYTTRLVADICGLNVSAARWIEIARGTHDHCSPWGASELAAYIGRAVGWGVCFDPQAK